MIADLDRVRLGPSGAPGPDAGQSDRWLRRRTVALPSPVRSRRAAAAGHLATSQDTGATVAACLSAAPASAVASPTYSTTTLLHRARAYAQQKRLESTCDWGRHRARGGISYRTTRSRVVSCSAPPAPDHLLQRSCLIWLLAQPGRRAGRLNWAHADALGRHTVPAATGPDVPRPWRNPACPSTWVEASSARSAAALGARSSHRRSGTRAPRHTSTPSLAGGATLGSSVGEHDVNARRDRERRPTNGRLRTQPATREPEPPAYNVLYARSGRRPGAAGR